MSKPNRYRGRLAYNGRRYHGFQRQSSGTLTIQSEVERALQTVTGQIVTVMGAGRTDTGVHALGQVIAFDCEWGHSPHDLWRAINANLPPDIVLKDLSPSDADFHPRFSAFSRRYCYQVYTDDSPNPLLDLTSWYVGSTLDLRAMQIAQQSLLGVHDFATFGQATQGESTTRHLLAAWAEAHEQAQYRFYFEANGFLKHMVRSLMGSLVMVGQGRWTQAQFEAAFWAKDRAQAATTAPPHGLILLSVTYGNGEGNNDSQDLDTQSQRDQARMVGH